MTKIAVRYIYFEGEDISSTEVSHQVERPSGTSWARLKTIEHPTPNKSGHQQLVQLLTQLGHEVVELGDRIFS